MTKEDKTRRLGSAPVGPLFLRLALPAVIGQLASLANNVVDRIWVGHIPGDGVLALQAVGISLPIQHVFIALLIVIVAGLGPTVSILLGKGNREEAGRVSGACFGISFVVSALAALVTWFLADWLCLSFGASEASLPLAGTYLRTIGWGLPFSNLLMLLTCWYGSQGYVSEGVKLNLLSVGINAVLDPVLIFFCGLGVTGAALATNAGAFVALVVGVVGACRNGRLVRFGPAALLPRPRLWLPTAALGLSTGINMGLESLSMMLMNLFLQRYGGDAAVATMAVFTIFTVMLVCLVMGLSMGAQPIVSYNYGTGDLVRVRTANRWFVGASFACSFVLWAVVMTCPRAVWSCFSSDPALLDYATSKTHLFFAFLLLTGVQYAHLYIARFLRKVKVSLFLGVLKRLILLLPLIFVLPAVLPGDKATSVLLAAPVTDAAAFVLTAICYFRIMKGLKPKEV